MNKRKTALEIMALLAFCCAGMLVVELAQPGYLLKSVAKLLLFAGCPILYSLCRKEVALSRYLKIGRRQEEATHKAPMPQGNAIHTKQNPVQRMFLKHPLPGSLLLGAGVYLLIVGAYFVADSWIDLDQIAAQLISSSDITPDNFLFVAGYITLLNSFLEEFFFRAFAFLALREVTSGKVATLVSAGLFAFYHVAITVSWFTLPLFVLVIFSLFVAGLIFNYLDSKQSNLYNSWLVHLCANLAINTIGLRMFAII